MAESDPKSLPKLFHAGDPESSRLADWPFVYAHGKAEEYLAELRQRNGWADEADDLLLSDHPLPAEPGRYDVDIYGRHAVAVLDYTHRRSWLCGRVAFADDPEGYAHACDPETWR